MCGYHRVPPKFVGLRPFLSDATIALAIAQLLPSYCLTLTECYRGRVVLLVDMDQDLLELFLVATLFVCLEEHQLQVISHTVNDYRLCCS